MSIEHSPARNKGRILRLKDVCARYSISPSTVYAWMKSNRLPPSVEFGPNTVGWYSDELDACDAERVRARDQALAES